MKITRRDVVLKAPLALAVTGFDLAQASDSKISQKLTFRAGDAVLTRNALPYLAWRYAGDKEWRNAGWQYIKIDFTYGISTARVAYDRKLTSFQSSRNMYRLFREASGPKMMLNACIGEAGRYALGLVEAARIGGDISAKWQTVKENLINVLLFAPTNGIWWQADPDVFYMRRENSALSAEESFVLTGTLGLMGGMFLTSDFPSQWSPEAEALVREFWNHAAPLAPTDQRIVVGDDGAMKAYRVSYLEKSSPRHRIAIYNWDDTPQTVRIKLSDTGITGLAWRVADRGYGKGLGLVDGTLISAGQPPHSLRIADLHRKPSMSGPTNSVRRSHE